MAIENNHIVLSPTVLYIIEQFTAAMRADAAIPDAAIERLEKLLRRGIVPKPDDINEAMFEPPRDGNV